MTTQHASRTGNTARILVLSMFLAPCREVGGKRFSFLSQYLSTAFPEYHVLARRERQRVSDHTAYIGNVHRCRMVPWFPPLVERGISYKLRRVWAKWICQVDPYIGWVLPATIRGVRLVKRQDLNVVIVTVPAFSAIVAALLITRATGTRLIIDYRDEWTNLLSAYRQPFGKYLSPAIERAAIKRAAAIVFCTDEMRSDFEASFESISDARRAVIFNGFEEEELEATAVCPEVATNMVYAGKFYGNRQLSIIAPAIKRLLEAGKISPRIFRLHLYSPLSPSELTEISREGLGEIFQVHEPVSYDRIRRILRGSDILFLPSGDEVNYAVPFKFFDYISARKPILAVASRDSAVYGMMKAVDCGEFAEIGNIAAIAAALERLIERKDEYTFDGADQFLWRNAAARYEQLIEDVATE